MTTQGQRRLKEVADFDDWGNPIEIIKKIVSSLPFKVRLVGKPRVNKGDTTAIFYTPVEVMTKLRTSLEKLDFDCQYTVLKQSGFHTLDAEKELNDTRVGVLYHSQWGTLTIVVIH